MTADAPLLELRGIVVRAGDRTILDVERLSIDAGATLAVLGANGAGKSTLLRVAGGLRAHHAGTVLLHGTAATRERLRTASAAVLQRPLLRRGSVRANAETGLRFHRVPRREARRRAERWMERLGVAHLADRPASGLSGGEAQRVSLARALALEPELLLLDEPFSALDAPTRAELLADLRDTLAGSRTAALLVTHDRDEAAALADRIAILQVGRVRQSGAARSVLDRPADAYAARLLGHVAPQHSARRADTRGVVSDHRDDWRRRPRGNSITMEPARATASLPDACATVRAALSVGRALMESLPSQGILVADEQLRILHLEGTFFARLSLDLERLRGTPLCEAMRPSLWAELGPRYRAALAGEHQSFDHWDASDQAHWAQIAPVLREDGRVTSVVAVIQEITERARSEQRLREAERMVGVGSFEMDLAVGAITCSDGFRRLLAVAPEDELDLPAYMALVHPDDRARVMQVIADVVEAAGSGTCEYRVVRPSGEVRTLSVAGEIVADGDGHPLFLRGAALDVTDEREAEHERLEALSLFQRGFDEAPIGMVLVDPHESRFVEVNDAMCRLLARSRDELVGVHVDEVTHPDDRGVVEAARSVLAGERQSHQAEKRYLRPDGGVVWVSVHVTPVRRSDGSTRAFFAQVIDITDRKRREERLEREAVDASWLSRIREALDEDRLVLYSQPIVDLATGETVQQELLLRMRAEDGSIIAPGEFLPVAERYGLIGEIDRWVIRQAVAIAEKGAGVEFNLSGMSIGDRVVLNEIESSIALGGADPSLLVVEVTETAMMDRLDAGRVFAERLTALGCGLALDDFGTGFSGLTHLKHLPARHLKIDMDFVRDVARSEDGARMVRGIVSLAREFDLITTAEGVEDEPTLAALRELGVDRAQGYLLGRPRPLD